jgi:hypothetical protein
MLRSSFRFSKQIGLASAFLLFSQFMVACAEEDKEEEEFEELTMQELVQALHRSPPKEFIVVTYNQFSRTKNPTAFAE